MEKEKEPITFIKWIQIIEMIIFKTESLGMIFCIKALRREIKACLRIKTLNTQKDWARALIPKVFMSLMEVC